MDLGVAARKVELLWVSDEQHWKMAPSMLKYSTVANGHVVLPNTPYVSL